MECYVLNSNFEQNTLFDGYLNFIWTERYASPSSFKIEMPNTYANRKLMSIGTILMISESEQPMVIETYYIKKQESGARTYIVEGRDLTTWLELRLAPWNKSFNNTRVSAVAANMIDNMIISGNAIDRIPNVSVRNIATDGAGFTFETTNDSLLANVQDVLNDNNCAIRADRILSGGSYSFRYNIYNGTRKSLTFDDRNDTLVQSQRVRSKKKLRNAASVAYKASNKEDSPTLFRYVYANGGSSSKTGLDRRVLRVDATNINPSDYPGDRLLTVIDRLGRAALGKQKEVNAIDGEVPAYVKAQYNKDYKLGDIVKFKSDDEVATDARVTEYIWIVDSTGFKEYPTIEVTTDITV